MSSSDVIALTENTCLMNYSYPFWTHLKILFSPLPKTMAVVSLNVSLRVIIFSSPRLTHSILSILFSLFTLIIFLISVVNFWRDWSNTPSFLSLENFTNEDNESLSFGVCPRDKSSLSIGRESRFGVYGSCWEHCRVISSWLKASEKSSTLPKGDNGSRFLSYLKLESLASSLTRGLVLWGGTSFIEGDSGADNLISG